MGKSKGWLGFGLAIVFAGGGLAAVTAVRQAEIAESNARNCTAVSTWVQSRGPFTTSGSGNRSVAILGDSYAAGEKLPDRSASWAFQLGQMENWTVYVDGIGNTGFSSGGFCGNQEFPKRTAPIKDINPSMVIIEGGLNDGAANAETIEASADLTLEALGKIPTVIIVGPTNAPAREGMGEVDKALAKAAAKHARPYISALTWDLPYLPDQLHLTEEGHRKYAALVSASLPGS